MDLQSIANCLPHLNKEEEKKIIAAYWEFQKLHRRYEQAGDALAMGEQEAFVGVVKQLVRETMRNERSSTNGNISEGRSVKAAGATIGIDCDSVPYIPTQRTILAQLAADPEAEHRRVTDNAILDQRPEWAEGPGFQANRDETFDPVTQSTEG